MTVPARGRNRQCSVKKTRVRIQATHRFDDRCFWENKTFTFITSRGIGVSLDRGGYVISKGCLCTSALRWKCLQTRHRFSRLLRDQHICVCTRSEPPKEKLISATTLQNFSKPQYLTKNAYDVRTDQN